MKICVAQTKPMAGDIQYNTEQHVKLIDIASSSKADIVIFPELSLTGYEPKLSKKLATDPNDGRLECFQKMSDTHCITIGVGMPIKGQRGTLIGMIIFQQNSSRQTYFKQYLHADELPYFVPGQSEIFLDLNKHKIAPAICYESLLPEHSERAFKSGANIYIASVAKSARGVEKAFEHFPEIAKKYSMPVLMSNCIGPSDNFVSVGKTSVWNHEGTLMGQLDDTSEDILVFDTDRQEVLSKFVRGKMK